MYTLSQLKKRWQENAKEPTNSTKFRRWVNTNHNVEYDSEKRGYMYTPKDLGCKNAAPVPAQVAAVMANLMFETVQQETKETSMYKDERTEAQQAKDYLIKSLDAAACTKQNEIREEFNLNSNPIKNLGELRKAVEGSWIKVDPAFKDYGDNYPVHFMFDFITVENPDRKIDREGAEKARKEMLAAQSDVKDQIVVMGPEKGLEALNEFKSKTFH